VHQGCSALGLRPRERRASPTAGETFGETFGRTLRGRCADVGGLCEPRASPTAGETFGQMDASLLVIRPSRMRICSSLAMDR